MKTEYVERAVQLLEQAVAMQATTQGLIQEAAILLREALAAGNNGQSNGRMIAAFPYIDHATLSVCWQGAMCNLGATIPLRLIERLCRRPNCRVCRETLLQDVWQGASKSEDTVRSTVRRLKRRLEDAGMAELAKCIRCEGGGYVLMLRDLD